MIDQEALPVRAARFSSCLVTAMAALTLLLAACSAPLSRMWLRPGVPARLPPLPALERPWQASQLLTVETREQIERIPVEVELSGDKLTVVAMTAWGTRLLIIAYDERTVQAQSTAPVGFLPPPEQVIADALLVNWPVRGWPLPGGWRLEQTPERRRLWDAAGQVVAEVRYPRGDGDVELVNHVYSYRLSIRTLAGDAPQP
jgi:hypothetical protein